MQIKRQNKRICPADSTKNHHPCRIAGWIWIVLVTVPTYASSIYRCGNSYSTNHVCADGNAVEIKPHVDPPQLRSPHQASPAVSDSKEAEALEKKRLASENKAGKQVLPRVIVTNPSTHANELETAHRRHAPNPYFTAKDPNSPPKKKSSTKALPTETN